MRFLKIISQNTTSIKNIVAYSFRVTKLLPKYIPIKSSIKLHFFSLKQLIRDSTENFSRVSQNFKLNLGIMMYICIYLSDLGTHTPENFDGDICHELQRSQFKENPLFLI